MAGLLTFGALWYTSASHAHRDMRLSPPDHPRPTAFRGAPAPHRPMKTQPAATYPTAVARIEAIRAAEGAEINPVCRTLLLSHGQKSERALVLFHGLTNCPRQWAQFAALAHERGFNVYVPRAPYHGLADRMTTDLARLTTNDLRDFAEESVTVAQGLGERVAVLGFSMGGVLATWVAQHRADVDRAVILSPGLALQAIPLRLTSVAARVAARLPNRFIWWDEEVKDGGEGPLHAYPRFSTRALAAMLRLGASVQRAARREPPAARQIVVATNPGDPALDNRAIGAVVAAWRRHGAAVQTYEFEAADHPDHDIIDPDQLTSYPTTVYPRLLTLLDEATP